jgi:hypothetical protein
VIADIRFFLPPVVKDLRHMANLGFTQLAKAKDSVVLLHRTKLAA